MDAMNLPEGARILPHEEWDRLAYTDLGPVVRTMNPDTTTVVVMEQLGKIVGCWAVFPTLMCHGLWLHPDHRHTRTGWRLWRALREVIKSRGETTVVTTACTKDVRELLAHVGAVSTGEEFVLRVVD